MPTVLMSLVEADRQYFKSASCCNGQASTGWNPLEACLCQDVVTTGKQLVVCNVQADPDHSARSRAIGAYAGVPLTTADGKVLGALCALADAPREWTDKDITVLKAVGSGVMSEIQRRIADRAAHDTQLRLIAERTLAHAVQQQMPVGVIVSEVPSGRLVSVNAQMTAIFRTSFKPAPDLKSYHELVGFHQDGTPYTALEWPLARTIITRERVGGEEIRILARRRHRMASFA